MERLTRTVQPPAVQSTRRFPRAKSDRHHQTLTYLGPQHWESRRANFTFATAVVAAAERRRVPLLSISFRYRSHFFSRTYSLLSSSPGYSFVRLSFVRSFARPTDRPRTPPERRRGTNNARFIKYSVRDVIYVETRYSPLFSVHAVYRDSPFFSSADAGDAHKDSSTRQPHAPRGAHTQRPNAFCNGDLWRETAEGPHDAPWITPPPGVRNVAMWSKPRVLSLRTFFSFTFHSPPIYTRSLPAKCQLARRIAGNTLKLHSYEK